MNALAGGGTFATLPALIALGLPANIANATSNVALLPGAAASAWTFRDELNPVAGIAVTLLATITFLCALAGGILLVLTPTETFDVIGERLPRCDLTLVINRRNGERLEVPVTCRLDTAEEVSIYEAGGVLQRFAQDFLESEKAA